jgi:hypothetical protein
VTNVRPIGLAILVAAFALSIGASAGAVGGKQRVVIQWKGASGFVLTPLTSGKLKDDTGTATFCCWKSRVVIRDGLRVEIGDPKMTLVGQRGTLVASNRMEFLDIRGGYSVFTGAWKVIRGTGDYAQLSGTGRVAGIVLPNGTTKWQREGVLGPN